MTAYDSAHSTPTPTPSTPTVPSVQASAATELLTLLAVTAPVLLSYTHTPTVTFYNQALAFFGWGAWCLWMSMSSAWSRAAWSGPLQAMLAALLILMLSQIAGPLWGGRDWGLPLQALGMTGAALLVIVVAYRVGMGQHRWAIIAAWAWATVLGAMLSWVLGAIQVFYPELIQQTWTLIPDTFYLDLKKLIAPPTVPGRAVGNLRQPNHLSTLFLMAAAALIWMSTLRGAVTASSVASNNGPGARDSWRQMGVYIVGLTLLVCGVVATGSRTGILGILLLVVWGLIDRRLPRPIRITLVGMPVLFILCWKGMSWIAYVTGGTFIGHLRLEQSRADLSSARFDIWSDALILIKHHPWWGVGWGEFNFAWTLTPLPQRAADFYDHSHNLILQFCAELGLPRGLLVTALLLVAYAGLLRRGRADAGGDAALEHQGPATLSMALYVVTLLMVHSLLEYPLWYSYFLLPAAFVWGIGLAAARLRAGSVGVSGSAREQSPSLRHVATAGGMVAMLAGSGAAVEYRLIGDIYAPREPAPPLEQRIGRGQNTWMFGHLADYAAATMASHPGADMPYAALQRTTHNLLDTRLLITWAKAEAERGQLDKARFLAHRLREFAKKPLSGEFLAVCQSPVADPQAPRPFQCEPDVVLSIDQLRTPSAWVGRAAPSAP